MNNGQNSLTYLIALGANQDSHVGPPEVTLGKAMAILEDDPFHLIRASRMYRTPRFPPGDDPDFVNAAAVVRGPEDPYEMLAALHKVESAFGRQRGERWASRSLDLDLIAAEGRVLPSEAVQDEWRAMTLEEQAVKVPDTLVLPHPRVQDRAFVLVPLAEIAPGWVHPRTGRSVSEMLAELPATQVESVRRM